MKLAEMAVKKMRAGSSLTTLGLAVESITGYIGGGRQAHTHDIVELALVVGGSGRQVFGDGIYEESAGYLTIINHGQHHEFIAEPPGLELINVYIDPDRFPLPALPKELAAMLPRILPLRSGFSHRQNQHVRLFFSEVRHVSDPLFAIERELKGKKAGWAQAVEKYFYLFLLECCRRCLENNEQLDSGGPASPGTESGLAENLRLYLERNATREITLEALANAFDIDRFYLCRMFKRYTGCTVFEYVLHRRLEKAMLMLRTKADKIIGVATECGFRDISHFNRMFRRELGVCPREYRKRWQG